MQSTLSFSHRRHPSILRRSALAFAAFPLLAIACVAVAQVPQAGARKVAILVELFTSEGCSDCPPADALLRAIDGTHLTDGPLIVALSEHVTYWDNGGWKDAFSAEAFTDRQNTYGLKFSLDSVYTPQMIVNGTQQFVGSNRQRLLEALHKEAERLHIALKISSIDRTADALSIQFSVEDFSGNKALDIMAVIADDRDETHVLHGENGGRTLTHIAVARSLQRIAKIHADGAQTVRLPLPPGLAKLGETPRHLILFAQQADQGAVLGADTFPFPPSDRKSTTPVSFHK